MIARLAFLALVLAIANSIPTTHVPNTVSSKEYPTFEEYCVKFNKEYDVHEYPFRKALYEKTLTSIITHNSENHSFKKGVNQFTDQTTAEFSRMFGYNKVMSWGRREMRKQRQAVEYRSEYFLNRTKSSKSDVSSIDWSALGATTAVKNQGHCGSCWAFAGTEAIESNVFLETGQLLTLAPQVYVDCVQNPNHCGGSGGCDGATCDLLFDYAVTGGGAFEVDYPYNASQGQCQSYVHQASIKGWVDVKENDDAALEQALLLQPITISVAASSWATYFGGVFPFSECDTDINHAVLLVGYGTDPVNGPYWKVQNSWGPTWGEDGFIRLARSSECGIDTKPLDGTGCPGGPSQVTVCGTCGMLFDSVYPTGGSVVKQRRF